MNIPTNQLEQAILQHRQGNLELAEGTYRDILRRQPANPDALHFLGLLLHQKGDSRHAIRMMEEALRVSPDYTDALKNLGNVHQECGDPGRAEQCYRKALEVDGLDGDSWNNLCVSLKNQRRYADAAAAGRRAVGLDPSKPANWLNLGNALAKEGQLPESADAYRRALELDRRFVPAHVELCHVLYRMERTGNRSDAICRQLTDAYRNWLAGDPDSAIARFMLSACEGGAPASRAPDDFVRELFDGFADSFDQNLAQLDYRVPKLIEQRLGPGDRSPVRLPAVLDAGCGTGLCGPFLRTISEHLTGVDLSPGMLAKAARRKQYDALIEAELESFLKTSPGAFDLVVAADTLVYFGDLHNVLNAVSCALKPGGRIVFSLELLNDGAVDAVRLNPSGRYAHGPAHVTECLAGAGLEIMSCTEEVLRKESGQAVRGLLIEARKHA